jgi:hypothetical protein
MSRAFGEGFLVGRMSRDIAFGRIPIEEIDGLFGWSDINELLARGSVAPAELRMWKDGAELPDHAFTTVRRGHRVIDQARVVGLMRQGHSLIVDGVDQVHPGLRAATDDVTRFVGAFASCNLFAAAGRTGNVTRHFDDYDILVLQLIGRKRWSLFAPTVPDPLPGIDTAGTADAGDCPSEPVEDRVLEPGSVLHVPRGWWHRVEPADELSVHLTFPISQRTGYDWLRWVLSRTLADASVRANLDRWGSGDDQRAQAERLADVFLAEASKASLADFFDDERRQAHGREATSLPWEVAPLRPPPSTRIEPVHLAAPVVETDGAGDGERLRIATAGQTFSLSSDHLALVTTLLESRGLTIQELADRAGSDVETATSLTLALLKLRLVRTVDR